MRLKRLLNLLAVRWRINGGIRKRNRHKSGPFCSRSCAGKYGAEKQNGRVEELGIQSIERKYFKLKKI